MNAPLTTERSVIGVTGRLAKRAYAEGDDLPEVGSTCLVSGANQDAESDQHRSFTWCRVIGYTPDNNFVCLQVPGCWPKVERLTNCWFADEEFLLRAAAPSLLKAARVAHRYLTCDSTPLSNSDIAAELAAAIAKAEGKL